MAFNNDEQPNLMNGSYDKLRERVRDDEDEEDIDEILKKMHDYSTTQTDMRFDLFANPKKLVPEDDMKGYDAYPQYNEKHHSDTHHSSHHRHDSERSETHHKYSSHQQDNDEQTIDDLMKDKPNQSGPKGGDYGPSYGPGQSMPSPISTKYEGFPNEEELLLGKLTMLRKLGELATQHGVVLSQNYSMASSYKSMKYEYELHKDIRDKYNGTKWLSNLMCNLCYGVELGNDYFDPFGFKLDGWSQQMEDDKLEYYEVLGEIYEKYFKSGKSVPPEIKLGFMMMSSAGKFHMQHSAIEKIPDLKEAMDNDPELYAKLRRQSQMEKEKIREHNEKQKATYDDTLNKQHDTVINKINDLNNLKKQEEVHMRNQKQEMQSMHQQQQIFQKQLEIQKEQINQNKTIQNELLNKQRHLEALQKQLNMQRSDCRSNYTETTNNNYRQADNNNQNDNGQKTMRQPFIPKSMQNKFSVTNKKPAPVKGEYNNANNMAMGGAIVTPDIKKFNDNVTVDDDIDNIISRGCETSYDSGEKSVQSVKKGRGRPRKNTNAKNTIKIHT